MPSVCSSLPPYAISFVVFDTFRSSPFRRCWKVSESITLHLALVSTFSSTGLPYVYSAVQFTFLCWVGHGINGLCSYSVNEERFTFFTVCLVWFNIVDRFGITTFCLVCLSGRTAFLKVVPLLAAVALLPKCRTLISFGWVVTTTIVSFLWSAVPCCLVCFDLKCLFFPANACCTALTVAVVVWSVARSLVCRSVCS